MAKSRYPNSVTPHWFTPSKAADSDFVLSGRLRMALIGTKELSSTRVDTEVNAGRVVLLGVVGTEAERKKAIRTARKLDGVVNVTSYLMLPPIAGEGKHAPKGQNFAGENPKNAPKPKPKEVKFEEKKI
ncbi:MAG: BON domain-containing protein [Desulfovibrio sp.]|nr:BON domain-containing protein [Desulfovibrio sp.]